MGKELEQVDRTHVKAEFQQGSESEINVCDLSAYSTVSGKSQC